MAKNIFILILIIILGILFYKFFIFKPPLNQVKISLNSKEYTLEVAKTVSHHAQGLMNRSSLCPTCGMIFVFNYDIVQTFWMKNTLIPLDMIFVDKDGRIDNILTAQPEPNTTDLNLKLYKSLSPVRYVIEINAGDTDKLSLKVGDYLRLPSL